MISTTILSTLSHKTERVPCKTVGSPLMLIQITLTVHQITIHYERQWLISVSFKKCGSLTIVNLESLSSSATRLMEMSMSVKIKYGLLWLT